MPRFYFNVFNDVVTIDEEGVDLPDQRAAEAQAQVAAAELIAEQLKAGEKLNLNHRIEIEDADHRIVYTLPFRALVENETDEE